MYFIDLLKNFWEIIIGFFLLTLWIGSDHSKIKEVEKNQKAHRKAHANLRFISGRACQEKMAQNTKMSNVRFAHGNKEFERFEDLLAAKEIKDENRHSDIMRILMDMNKQ